MPSKPKKLTRPALSIRYVSCTALKPDPKNPRIHTDKQVRQIARSIEAFGFNVPILVDQDQKVIAGHGRLLAARLLNWNEVPVIRLEHLSAAQRSAFLIADNRLTENASWDERLLGEQLEILAASNLDFDLDITGFEMGEIDVLLEGLQPEPEATEDAVAELDSGPPVSKPGDLWLLGKHRVLCGDALDPSNYQLLMNGKQANLVFEDPPYNVRIDHHATGLGRHHHREFAMASGEMSETEFITFLRTAFENTARNSAAGSVHFICMDWRHVEQLLAAGKQVYSELLNICVWVKDNGGMGSLYRSQHELVFVFKNGQGSHRNNIQLGKYGRYRTNVWNYPNAQSFGRSEGNLAQLHPTVKPVAMVADAILDCSARGDLVLDPFLGSGTTLIAAERKGRICYGLELDPLYVDIIIRRWQKFAGATATLANSTETFCHREEVLHA